MADRISWTEEWIEGEIKINRQLELAVEQQRQRLLDAQEELQSYRLPVKQFKHWRSEIADREEMKKSMWRLGGEYPKPHHTS